MNSYDILAYPPDRVGIPLRIFDFNSLDYVLNENAAGALTLRIPPVLPFEYFTEGVQIEVWRQSDGGAPLLEGSCQWFVEKTTEQRGDERLLTIEAVDGMALLARRHCMFPAGTPAVRRRDEAIDDIMKRIMRDNFWPAGYTFPYGNDTRYPSDPQVVDQFEMGDLFSVQADTSQLPVIDKSFAWRNVADVMRDLVEESLAAGVYAAFRMVQVDNYTGQLEFRTYKDIYGADKRVNPTEENYARNGVILSEKFGAVSNIELVRDWSQYASTVVAGGAGEGSARAIGGWVEQPPSAWGYREVFIDKTDTADGGELVDYAGGQISLRRPRLRFSAQINETQNVHYGRDYGLGWIVTAEAGNIVSDCRVSQIHVSVDQETGETIEAKISSDSVLT